MERLAERVLGFVQLKSCENDFCKETCAEHDAEKSCNNCPIQKAYEKLAEYEDLEEQGKLPKLPCAVGDTAWIVFEGEIFKSMVSKFDIARNGIFPMLRINETLETISVSMKTLKKTWFLTKEEAEAAKSLLEKSADGDFYESLKELVSSCSCEFRQQM